MVEHRDLGPARSGVPVGLAVLDPSAMLNRIRQPHFDLHQAHPDILRELSSERLRAGQMVVGFASETGDETGSVLDLARAKLARKGCDLLVVNDVSGGAVFGSAENEAVILAADGSSVAVPRGSKSALAHVIWDQVATRLQD